MEIVAQEAEWLAVTEKVAGSWPVDLPCCLLARAGEMGYLEKIFHFGYLPEHS